MIKYMPITTPKIYFAAVFLTLLHSCSWIDPPEPAPAWIKIAPFSLTTDPRSQGSASSNITEAWVQVNGTFLGAYTLPAVVPVLDSGNLEISISPGIRENGISTTPDIYPFYQEINIRKNLSAGETLEILPRINYRSNARFPLLESFENDGHAFQLLVKGNESNRIRIDRENPFEGSGSGAIELNAQNPEVVLATTSKYSGLTTRGAFVFLEVDYQSDVPVVFGVIATNKASGASNARFVSGFNPSPTWKKIYFNFSPETSGSVSEDYQVIIRAAIPINSDGTLSRTNARVKLDNIKLVHF
jgi:hypothetical protein